VCVNLNKTDNETLALRQYVHHVVTLCQMTVIRNWTGCAHCGNDSRERLDRLTKTEGLLKEITGQETGGKRTKRGVFKFLGELSKILFGTTDYDDVHHDHDDGAKYKNEQIKLFEQNSQSMYTLLNQQLSVVRSSF